MDNTFFSSKLMAKYQINLRQVYSTHKAIDYPLAWAISCYNLAAIKLLLETGDNSLISYGKIMSVFDYFCMELTEKYQALISRTKTNFMLFGIDTTHIKTRYITHYQCAQLLLAACENSLDISVRNDAKMLKEYINKLPRSSAGS